MYDTILKNINDLISQQELFIRDCERRLEFIKSDIEYERQCMLKMLSIRKKIYDLKIYEDLINKENKNED